MKLVTTGILLLLAAFPPFNQKKMEATKTFMLVHGAWQAPYAWQGVKDRLEKKSTTSLLSNYLVMDEIKHRRNGRRLTITV